MKKEAKRQGKQLELFNVEKVKEKQEKKRAICFPWSCGGCFDMAVDDDVAGTLTVSNVPAVFIY